MNLFSIENSILQIPDGAFDATNLTEKEVFKSNVDADINMV